MALFNRHTSGTQYPISNITVYWESLGRSPSLARLGLTFLSSTFASQCYLSWQPSQLAWSMCWYAKRA